MSTSTTLHRRTVCTALSLAGLLSSLTLPPLTAQQPPAPSAPAATPAPPAPPIPAPPPGRRRNPVPAPGQPGQPGAQHPQIPALNQNYLVKLEIQHGAETQTIELLTASPMVSFNSVLGKSPSTVVTFSGTLQETEEGTLVLGYSVGGRVPEVTETSVPGTNPAAVARRIEYNDETGSGAIHVTPGAAQTILKSGDRRYILTITPDAGGK